MGCLVIVMGLLGYGWYSNEASAKGVTVPSRPDKFPLLTSEEIPIDTVLFRYATYFRVQGDKAVVFDLHNADYYCHTFTYPDFKVNISASIADFKGFEKMTIKGENGEIRAPFFHMYNKVICKKSFLSKEVFKGRGPKIISYLDEFDAVSKDIRSGKKESDMVPLKATSDVMHILDKIREQIGLSYDNLE